MSHPEGDTEEDWQLGDSHIYTCALARARACRSQSLSSFYKSVYVPLLYTLFLDAYDNRGFFRGLERHARFTSVCGACF